MEKRNVSALKTLILLGMIIAPSFYLLSSYSPRYIPAGKRPVGYRKGRPQRRARSSKLIKSVPQESVPVEEEVVPVEVPQTSHVDKNLSDEDEREKSSESTVMQAGEKDVKVASPVVPAAKRGMLTALYATIAPVILVTLNTALGIGIAVSTKSFIKQWMARKNYLSLRNKFLDEANEMFKPEFLEESSDDDKVEAAMAIALQNHRLSPKEVMVFNQLKEQSSVSSIFGQVISAGALNTFAQMTGSLIGLVATMALQTLMPAK